MVSLTQELIDIVFETVNSIVPGARLTRESTAEEHATTYKWLLEELDKWKYVASHDPQTDLETFEVFITRLSGLMAERAEREKITKPLVAGIAVPTQEGPATVVFCDLNNYGQINKDENLGHEAGDMILHYVADILKRSVNNKFDFVTRRNRGDEFVFVFDGFNLQHTNEAMAEIQKQIYETKFLLPTRPPRVLEHLSMSFGCHELVGTEITKCQKAHDPIVQQRNAAKYAINDADAEMKKHKDAMKGDKDYKIWTQREATDDEIKDPKRHGLTLLNPLETGRTL